MIRRLYLTIHILLTLQSCYSRYTFDSGASSSRSILTNEKGHNLTVLHSSAQNLEDTERVAFSLRNNTGECVRIHTHAALETELSSSQTVIGYLDHLHTTGLSFPATETKIKNLHAVEVPMEGESLTCTKLYQVGTLECIHWPFPSL